MYFKQIFDKKLAQYAYLIGCQATGEAIVVDPMRDVDQYYDLAQEEGLEITAAADTHIHADYVSGLRELAERGVTVYASDEGGSDWKYDWLKGSDYEYRLLTGGDTFSVGNIKFDVLHTPGHTPESVSILVTDRATTNEPMGILSGDFVFVGDVGRPDLLETAAGQKGAMKPAAKALYKSTEQFKNLPDYLQVWPAHGSGSACGKALGAVPESTVGYERRFSPAFKAATSENEFVEFILDGQPEPPLYFARMKRWNKEGSPVLGELPQPKRLSLEDMIEENSVIVDTRDRRTFMQGHIPGSLLAPLNKQFNTVVGSYVEADKNICLVIDEGSVEQAVRDLVRVGLDNIKGFTTPEDLKLYFESGGMSDQIKTIDLKKTAKLYDSEEFAVLDVRKATEFAEGHIPNAINIAHIRLKAELDSLSADKTLIVHCRSGARAAIASSMLRRGDFDVLYVDDHIDNWPEAASMLSK